MDNSGDYISREAATALAKDIIVPTKDGGTYRHRCIDPQDIRELPAADVRPVVRGKWEDVEVTDVADKTTLPITSIVSMRCTECNRYHNEVYFYG